MIKKIVSSRLKIGCNKFVINELNRVSLNIL